MCGLFAYTSSHEIWVNRIHTSFFMLEALVGANE